MSPAKPLRRTIKSTCPVLPSQTPSITTPRLIIRPLAHSDLAAYHKIRTSPAVMKFSQQQRPDVDIAFTKTKLDPSLPPQNRAIGTLTFLLDVEERLNPGVLIGDMGCHDVNPGTEEVGYMFLDGSWGKGYATEALKAYLDHYRSLPRREYFKTVIEGRRRWGDDYGQ
jgi:RimJ/RimL family protein N-acetyltransferase